MTNTQALAKEINALINSESRSFASHMVMSRPYVDAKTHAAWIDLKKLVDQDKHDAQTLTQLLLDHDLPEYPGTYTHNAAFFHFTDIPTLIPQVIEEANLKANAYSRCIQHARGNDDIIQTLQELLEITNTQLQNLQTHLETFKAAAKA